MPLLPTAETRQRHREKFNAVLCHLRDAIYSTTDILGEVMDIVHRQTVQETLRKMEGCRLITHQDFHEQGGMIRLWGITATGQDRVLKNGQEPNSSVFNPSKISFTYLLHYLDMQRIQVRALKASWSQFIYVDRHCRKHPAVIRQTASIRPDFIATNGQGHIAAIECERTRKSFARYKTEILPGHVRNLNAGDYEFVLWITLTSADQQELYTVITKAVDQLIAEQTWQLTLAPAAFKRFQFANLQSESKSPLGPEASCCF
jgi:hypothetical protein